MDPFEDNMNKALRSLVADIIPKDAMLEKANRVIQFLQAESKSDIGSVCIAGSTGKKTTIMDSDIDCVLFINGKEPPFEDVLEDFDDILIKTDRFSIKKVRKTPYSIHFKALEVDFDILPAANLTVGLHVGGDEFINEQQKRVLKIIAKDAEKNSYMYSSSLAYSAVRFMKKQDGFVNDMVRLAKYWYKTLHFSNEYNVSNHSRSGAKNCIELIAVHAACKEMGIKSHLSSFNRFIAFIQNFSNLNIDFGNNGHPKVRPRVMDPVNPHNNLASCWDSKSIQLLKQYANETHTRLQSLASSRIAHLDTLFESQTVCPQDVREILGFDPTKLKVLFGTTAYNSSKINRNVRNKIFQTDKRKMFLDTILENFKSAINAAKASGGDENQIKKAIQNMIDKQIGNTNAWSSSLSMDTHENYDVTLTVPFDSNKAIQVSFKQ